MPCLAPDPRTAVWEGQLHSQRGRAEKPWQAKSTRELKPCKVGLIGCISPWGYHCPLSLTWALSSSEAAIPSVVLGGLLSFTDRFWHRLFWRFQNLPLLKPCPGIANLHANLATLVFFSSSNTGLLINNGQAYTESLYKKKKQERDFCSLCMWLGVSNYVSGVQDYF